MAEATVVLNRLLPWIEKEVRKEATLLLDADNQVFKLSQKLNKIVEVLADAEQRLVKDPKVKSWLEELQEIAYEIEDAMEEWEVENFKQKLQESEEASQLLSSDSWVKKVCYFLETFCLCFKQTVKRRALALDVQQIHQRLDSLSRKSKDEFDFIPNLGYASQRENHQHVISTSFVDETEVKGRGHDKDVVMRMLLPESNSQEESVLKIVSIVGAGGMGKTTLAQLIFKDARVREQFGVKIWVCVSNPFVEVRVYKAILEIIDKDSSSQTEPQALLEAIEKAISGKCFFLVLDDVWTETDINRWKPLKASLKNAAPGSCILVTTRKQIVADVVGSACSHLVKELDDTDCWSILNQMAPINDKKKSERARFAEVGLEIAKKCNGLPLAATVIGSLLRLKPKLRDWEIISKSDMWEMKEVENGIFPFLRFSYDELLPAVRRCFSYCAIFPKGWNLDVDYITIFWMAQGFLSSKIPKATSSSSSSSASLEKGEMELGRDYFDELAMRSFFQDLKKDDDGVIVECKMHDIVHDFAQFLTRDECFKATDHAEELRKGARHLVMLEGMPHSGAPQSIGDFERLRTFLCGESIPLNLFVHLKRVRSLVIPGCNIKDVPVEIGNLIHLRFLALTGNPIKELPKAICDLYYLQTLDVSYCRDLCGLPKEITKLVNLRHLLNKGTSKGFSFPEEFGALTDLQTLQVFCATKLSGNKLGCLRDLNKLRGTLKIEIDCEAIDKAQAEKAGLADKKWINEVILKCNNAREDVVEALQPHPHLQRLTLRSTHLPRWISSLTSITVDGGWVERSVDLTDFLSQLGKLGSLEVLCLQNFSIKEVSCSSFSSPSSDVFPNLKKLAFRHCFPWREWEDLVSDENKNEVVLPSLKALEIVNSGLEALPHRFLRKVSGLNTLSLKSCHSLKERYNEKTGEDWRYISFIPNVVFSDGF